MTYRFIHTALFIMCLLTVGCSTPPIQPRGDKDSAYGEGNYPQLFSNMGDYRRKVTTDSSQAQRYFSQGLKWMYGFNHDEAVRSFTKAAELDPGCAMAWWGIAYAQGPNYNSSRPNEARKVAAWEAIQRAVAELDDETPAEQALIRATTKRYQAPAPKKEDTKADQDKPKKPAAKKDDKKAPPKKDLKADFAAAMAKVWADHPRDADIGAVYADAMMLRYPWRLFKSDGTPARDLTLTIIKTLDEVIAFAPEHPGANHLYIHAVEAGKDKSKGVPAADRLSTQVPASGHLTHMPSHIYVQAGMWQRSVEQNLLAIKADKRYFAKAPQQYRQHGYAAHNGHMLAFAGMMAGRERDAMAGAMHAWESIPEDLFDTMGKRYDRALCAKFDVLKRFGRWDRILAEPAPPEDFKQTTAVWRTCRAVAFAAKKDFKNAAIEQAEYRKLLEKNKKNTFFKMNDLFIAAEIALHQEKWDESIKLLEEAVKLEDKLGYSEPPRWLQPIRHTLGAVYFRAGRYAEAERVYRADLKKWPHNGWSLYGLGHALKQQGKAAESDKAFAEYEKAWKEADMPLKTTCKCIPKL